MTKPWEQFRKEIVRLYIREERTLQEVQRIMKTKHKFDASIRSYRQWFDKWDVTKYNCKKRQQRRRLMQRRMMSQQFIKQEGRDDLDDPTLNVGLSYVKGQTIVTQDSLTKAQKPQDLITGVTDSPSPKVEVKKENSFDYPLAYTKRSAIVTPESLASDQEHQELITGASNSPSPRVETNMDNYDCSPQTESHWSRFSSSRCQNICQQGAFAPETPRYQGPEYFYSTPRYGGETFVFTLTDKPSLYHEDRVNPSWGILSPPSMDYDLSGVGQDASFMR